MTITSEPEMAGQPKADVETLKKVREQGTYFEAKKAQKAHEKMGEA